MKKYDEEQTYNKWIRRTGIALLWLGIWQAAALLMDNRLLFAGPVETAAALCREAAGLVFWQTLAFSLLRILAGFFLALLLGSGLGAAAYRWPLLEAILAPVMQLGKAVPVASFAVILLIWWGAEGLSVSICFLVVLPLVYVSFYEGLQSADRKLLEMADVFGMSFWKKAFYIYRPAMAPFLEGCLKTALSMGLKAGVAAEVIGISDWSIGGELYLSKIYLDTAGVFAWTAVIMVLSFGLEKAALSLWKGLCRLPMPGMRAALQAAERQEDSICRDLGKSSAGNLVEDKVPCRSLTIDMVSKAYGAHTVLKEVSGKLEAETIYCLMAPSGAGKTTLLHLLAGLIRPDAGSIRAYQADGREYRDVSCAVVFQEDRLCEEETALVNVLLASPDPGRAAECLRALLPEEALGKPVKNLSGGMRRRVCIARALAAEKDILLLDEPFSGLDEDNRRRAAEVIRHYREGRLLVAATHEAADAEKLQAKIWRLQPGVCDGDMPAQYQ